MPSDFTALLIVQGGREFAYFLPIPRTNSRQRGTNQGKSGQLANCWQKKGSARIGNWEQGEARRGKSPLFRLSPETPGKSPSCGLGFYNLETEYRSLLLEMFELLAAAAFLVVLHPFIDVLLTVLQHSIHDSG